MLTQERQAGLFIGEELMPGESGMMFHRLEAAIREIKDQIGCTSQVAKHSAKASLDEAFAALDDIGQSLFEHNITPKCPDPEVCPECKKKGDDQ